MHVTQVFGLKMSLYPVVDTWVHVICVKIGIVSDFWDYSVLFQKIIERVKLICECVQWKLWEKHFDQSVLQEATLFSAWVYCDVDISDRQSGSSKHLSYLVCVIYVDILFQLNVTVLSDNLESQCRSCKLLNNRIIWQ